MQMTTEQQIQSLLQRIAMLEGRVATLEARGMTYGPIPNPYVPPTVWPSYPLPPFTISVKMPDGTTKEINLDSPVVAQTNETTIPHNTK